MYYLSVNIEKSGIFLKERKETSIGKFLDN